MTPRTARPHADHPHADRPSTGGPPAPRGPALVAVAHGSRDPRALRTVSALLDRVRRSRPGLDVQLGHIELNEPLLGDTLDRLAAQGGREAVLVPLLLGRGHHVKVDLPAALAAEPRLRAVVAAPLGADPLLAEVLHARLAEAGWAEGAGGEAVVLAAAGSRDPDSAADTARTAALLSARLGGVPVVPAYASAAAPTVPAALAALRSRGLRRIAVASCFTAPGRFAAQSAAAAPWIASAPLGAHPAMARLVLARHAAGAAALAATARRPLPALVRATVAV
ncbi:sirohydrochlorin chelatase [Streptomyces sp. V4-01]|uniref:Sirohydrochlorin chelatase n=1 Tax=Actinacidiphila polyblastidii TaxID=3110430 RepID=A0ABU7PF18_9ACTN|nr:sirohydrochlorin chelatase [Streptomyces sp. V4-01]